MYVKDQYRHWLMTKVIIECWTLRKCAKVLGRNYTLVEQDFVKFNAETKDPFTDIFSG